MPNKPDIVLRNGLRNIASLPTVASHSKKSIFILDIINGNFDIFCATKVNVAWHNVKERDSISERFRGQLEFSKFIYSNNTDKQFTDTYQRGGTITVCQGPMCARMISNGVDSSRLGRWSWIKIRGSRDITLVIITMYHPVFNTGALSTYQQQKAVRLDKDDDSCP
jgi:hypothetical protein